MTPSEWLDHAAKCRTLAETMEDEAARRVLLEAADDYLKTARREAAARVLLIPTYQIGPAGNRISSGSRMR